MNFIEINEETRQELLNITKDIEEGKNLSAAFDNAEDALVYLKGEPD